MKIMTKLVSVILLFVLILGLCSCSSQQSDNAETDTQKETAQATSKEPAVETETQVTEEETTAVIVQKTDEMLVIEEQLNLSNMNAEWTYNDSADAWTLSVVTAVTAPVLEDYEGVSVCIPGAYVKGIDTDGDGAEDATSGTVNGVPVINHDASVTSTNGQIYTADTAPVIVNTGAAGYGSQSNQNASSTYAAEGYINVACGNRGKQSTYTAGSGNTLYTGDAPSCLVDQKSAVRFVKYNILLGNLPGSVDHFVSTGGSGGGAHAAMIAATSDNPDFYDYEIAVGAVGIYKDDNGNYISSVTIDGEEVDISDGMWGCIAYSAITSLAEADMAMGFEYYLDSTYGFKTSFQKQMAEYLAAEYMEYINGKSLQADESAFGFDLNEDGDTDDTVDLTIEYDEDKYPESNGYYGTYVNLYLAEFQDSLNDYLARLDHTEDWTWFDEDGNPLSDNDVAAMTYDDRALAFIEGRYVKGSTSGSSSGGMQGGPQGNGAGGPPDMGSGGPPSFPGNPPSGPSDVVGTPDAGTTQSASGSSTDSANYPSFEDMLEEYKSDIAEIVAGDEYGKNIVKLYDPVNYIGAAGTKAPTWTRILMGASEGDISMFNSLNMQIAWINAGTDADIEWQWNGGHVPSEILGDSLALYVDMMYGKYVDGAVSVAKAAGAGQSTNGTATEATGTDISGWVSYSDGVASFSLADAAAYRTAKASKAIPGFDVMDYGQEDYVFGNASKDARHWDKYVLKIFEDRADTLSDLFNK